MFKSPWTVEGVYAQETCADRQGGNGQDDIEYPARAGALDTRLLPSPANKPCLTLKRRVAAAVRRPRQGRVHGGKGGRPLSRATVDYVHAILRKAFNDAVRSEQLLLTNPAERAKRPRGGPRGARVVLTAAQLRIFLKAASPHRLSAFFRVAAYTGARRGELGNLRWADVDWHGPAIRIKGSVGIIAGKRVEGTTKGGRERIVGLGAGTVDVLRGLRRKQVEDQLALGDAWTETGHVFTSGDGVPINPPTA